MARDTGRVLGEGCGGDVERLKQMSVMNIELNLYCNELETACSLIRKFWQEHNNYQQSVYDSHENLKEWTKDGHRLYLIRVDDAVVGFVHMGSRGSEIDWLEDIFVLPEYQGNGIGTYAIRQMEEIVKEYSDSLYIEAAAWNKRAMRLYQKIGYDCLNTITIRKDFHPERFEKSRTDYIAELEFDVKRRI